MKRATLYALIISVLGSCGPSESDTAPVPTNLIQRDTLVLLLAESAIFNAQSQHRDTRKKLFKDIILQHEKAMFDSLGVSQVDFKASIEYYARNPKEMEAMYDNAMNLLTTRLAEVGKSPGKDTLSGVHPAFPAVKDRK